MSSMRFPLQNTQSYSTSFERNRLESKWTCIKVYTTCIINQQPNPITASFPKVWINPFHLRHLSRPHKTHTGRSLREVVWPLSSLNAIIVSFVFLCCWYRFLTSLTSSLENSTAEMLVSQLADITWPGTQRHIFHGTSSQLFHKFRQLLPSQGFHLNGFHGYLPWRKKHWSGNKGVFKKSRRFTEVQDVIVNI